MAGFEAVIQGLGKQLQAFTAGNPAASRGFSVLPGAGGGFSPGGPSAGGFSVGGGAQPGGWQIGSSQSQGFAVGQPGGGGFRVGGPGGGGFGVGGPGGGGFQVSPVPKAQPEGGTATVGSAVGSGWDYTGPATAEDNKTLTADKVNAYIAGYERQSGLKSPLAGLGADIIRIANEYGVSAPLLLGIARKESQLGGNPGAGNIFGITDPSRDGGLGGRRAFQSYDGAIAEIRAAAANLATATYKGKSAAEQIGNWYVGPEEYKRNGLAATDKAGNGTVQDYLDGIAEIYQALGVTFQQNQAGVPTGGGSGDLAQINTPWARQAQQFLGIPYTNGGIRNTGDPRSGMDCSSFVGYVMGLDRGRWNAQTQYDSTKRVSSGEARAGDLVFFQGTTQNDPSARPVTHVGIYIGNGKMVHTGGAGGVMVVDLNTAYWQNHLYGFGRL